YGVFVAGDNLGGTGGGSTQVRFGFTPSVGPLGQPTTGTLAGWYGDNTSTGTGSGLVTYDPAVGVRLLSDAEYATNPASYPTFSNVRITAPGSPDATIGTLGSLTLSNGVTFRITLGNMVTLSRYTVLAIGAGNVIDGTGT